jgi:hypothetical protein
MQLQAVNQITSRPRTWFWPGRLALAKLARLDGDPGLGKSLPKRSKQAPRAVSAPSFGLKGRFLESSPKGWDSNNHKHSGLKGRFSLAQTAIGVGHVDVAVVSVLRGCDSIPNSPRQRPPNKDLWRRKVIESQPLRPRIPTDLSWPTRCPMAR